jgi:hypothetical protein
MADAPPNFELSIKVLLVWGQITTVAEKRKAIRYVAGIVDGLKNIAPLSLIVTAYPDGENWLKMGFHAERYLG